MYYEHHGILCSISKPEDSKATKQNGPNITTKDSKNYNEITKNK
ncbi:hypothetical protein GA0061087_10522 [Priestia flexa]|nr:hypothetical protein GA0061087_10522 [Priestia flexa]